MFTYERTTQLNPSCFRFEIYGDKKATIHHARLVMQWHRAFEPRAAMPTFCTRNIKTTQPLLSLRRRWKRGSLEDPTLTKSRKSPMVIGFRITCSDITVEDKDHVREVLS